MNRYSPLVAAIALALVPVALQATTLDSSSTSVVGASPLQTRSDAMAEALARMGLYRYSTRYQTVVQPTAPIYVTAPAPTFVAPSAPPAPAADCDSSAAASAPAVAAPVAPVVLVAPSVAPEAPVAPAAASPFPTEPTAPALPTSQARLQDFFIQVLGARSRLKLVNVTAAPVVIQTPAAAVPAPVVVAQAAPKPACTPKGESSPPAGSAAPEQLADLGIESFGQGDSGEQGQDSDEFFTDAIDPPRPDSEPPMEFAFDGPALFSVQEELLVEEPLAVVGRVPEPGSLALLGLGLIGLGMSRRRATTR